MKRSNADRAKLTEQVQQHNSSGRGKSFGIQTKAIALATIFGVLPVLAVGSFAYRIANYSITKQISSQNISEAQQLSNTLSLFLQDRLANIKAVVRVVNIVAKDTQFIDSKINPKQNQALAEQLTFLLDDYGFFSNIALYDLQGQLIVQSRSSAPEDNWHFPYLQQALQAGVPIISEPIQTKSGSLLGLAVYAVAPIKDNSGKITAVVAAKIPVEAIGNAILSTSGSHQSTTYHLIDSSGKIIQALNEPEAEENKNSSEEFPGFDRVHAQKQSQAWIAMTDDGERLLSYAPVKNAGNLDWSIVNAINTTIAFAPQRNLLQATSWGTLITAILAALLAATLAKRVLQPLLQATAVVKKLGQGELDSRIEIQGNDELADLAANINQMAEQIQSLLEKQRQNAEQLFRQNDILTYLARSEGLIDGNAKAAAKEFTETTAKTLAVARTSIWLFNSNYGGLACVDLYEDRSGEHSEARDLKAVDFPAYFDALKLDFPIVANDARTHLATSELSVAYLTALGIKSKLDIPIRNAGKVVGVVCCEHVGEARQWKAQEIGFVTSIANLMSLALESELLQNEVGDLLAVVSEVEEGDLTTRAHISDRTTGLVADTFNRLLEQLGQVLSQVLSTAQAVSATSISLGEAAQTVATNTQQQAEEVTQVLHLTEQVEQYAQSSALAVNLTNQSLLNVRLVVEEGQGTINTLTQGIEVLKQGTDRIIQQMKVLGEFVGLADQFMQDQSHIASQTQVLALNATLVAARASQQRDPRQFSVVAREFEAIASQVSTLAQQTNDGLIALQQRTDQIRTVVSAVDGEMQNLGGLVSGFTTGVEQSNQVFGNVSVTTGQLVQKGEAVAQSSQEIVNAVQSTTKAMHEIAQLASQTALLTTQAQQRSQGMEMLSSHLLGSIQFFRLPAAPANALPGNLPLANTQSDATKVTQI